MDDEALQSIKQHLQSKEAQTRILKNIEHARAEATMTIGRAASLFDFTENQLRDWEVKNRLTPNKSSGGQRLYPLTELDKLAIIRELLDAKFSPGDIPENIDTLWYEKVDAARTEEPSIDHHVEQAENENSWRYFVSQVMRLALLHISEDTPDTIIGMILPLRTLGHNEITDPRKVSLAGPSLVGWLSNNRTFYAFLSTSPSFEYPSDFRVEQFRVPGVEPSSMTPLIIVQRKSRPLSLTKYLVQSVQRLLTILSNHVDEWRPCFDYGMRDYAYQIADFSSEEHVIDRSLNDLMDRVVELGGKTSNGRERWSFSVLLLPLDDSLPIQQRSLMVRVYSKRTPLRLDALVVSGNYSGLSFRAYQSGHVIYRPHIPPDDYLLPNRETEEETRSAIAIPIAGEDGMAVAVLYVASNNADAFPVEDQRALRLMTGMIEELLSTYQSSRLVVGKLTSLLDNPGLGDPAFREFLSEDDFINDLEAFLETIRTRNDIEPKRRPDPGSNVWLMTKEAISLIGVDIDNQGSLATKYGDRVARNLSREVGLRIRGQLQILSRPEYQKLYHINADNYYMMLPGMSLEEARKFYNYHLFRSGFCIIDTIHKLFFKKV